MFSIRDVRSTALLLSLILAPFVRAQVPASVVRLLATPNPVVQGQNVTVAASVIATAPGAASGAITVTDQCSGASPTPLGTITLDATGAGTLVVSSFPCLGANTIVATYSGDDSYAPGVAQALIETLLLPSAPTSVALSSFSNPSTSAQNLTLDAAMSFSGYCPFTVDQPFALISSTAGTVIAQGPRNYAIDFTGNGVVVLPSAGSFTYDPATGFSGFQLQWLGGTFDLTAAANNASGCGTTGPALAFALLQQSLTSCPSGTFEPYAWSAAQPAEGAPKTFGFSYGAAGSSAPDVVISASVACPSNSCGNTFGNGTWAIRDTSTAPAPTVSCSVASSSQVGSPFDSPAMSVTGGTAPYAFTVVGTLPPGLTLDSSTGAITGTPTAAGAFAVKVTDANGVEAPNSSPPRGTVKFTNTSTGNVVGSASLVTSGGLGKTKTGASFHSTQPLAAGSYAVQATYSGDNTYAASTSSLLSQVVQPPSPNPTTTTLNTSTDPTQVLAGQTIVLTALVSAIGGTPTGTVSFGEGAGLLGAVNLDPYGQTTLTASAQAVGTHAITALYGGDGNFAPSSSTLNVTVQPAPLPMTTTTLNSSANPATVGDSLTLAATVTSDSPGTPTGTVTFQDGFATLGTVAVGNAVAALSVSLTGGTHTLSAIYSGDSNFTASVGAVTEVVNPPGLLATATTIGSSANPSAYGQTISFTAAESGSAGTATGAVTFSTGSVSAIVDLDATGTAVFTTAALPEGSVPVSIVYSGDGVYAGGTSLFGQTVNQASTTTVLAVSQAGALTAKVSVASPGTGSPTGTVSFVTDTSQTLCAGAALQADGTATCTPASLPTVQSITATYGGDMNFMSSSDVITSAQTITFAALADQAFGTAPFALSATASSGLAVSFSSSTPGACTVTGAIVTLVAGGTCTVQATQAGNVFYAAATPVNQSFNVTQANQTINFAAPANQVLSTPSFMLIATASSGLAVSFTSSTPGVCTVAGATVTLVATGTCTIQATQAGNATYAAATPVSRSFTVSKASQTITFATPPNQLLSTPSYNLNATASSGRTVTFASSTTAVCTVAGATATLVAAGTCTIQATQAGDTTYNAATPVTRSFTVSKASQTITFATPPNQVLSTTSLTLNATASSGLTVSFTSSTTGVCTVAGATVTLAAAGTCTIQATQAGNTAYTAATAVSRSFTVTKASQTISFGTLANQTVGSPPFTVSATASSNLTVTFASTTSAVCTLSLTTVTLVAGGTCTIQATQAGNAFYSAAPSISRSFTVTKVSQTITFGTLANQAVGSPPFTVSATASSNLPVTFASTTNGVCTLSVTTVTLVGGGTCTIQATQAGNATYAAATAVSRSFTVTKLSQTITFGALSGQPFGSAPFAVSATATSGLTVGFSSQTTRVCTVAGTTVTLIAAGTCTIQATQAGNATYAAATSVSRSFTVTKASQTITFAPLANQALSTASFALSATASSALAVNFTASPTTVCRVSGATVSLLAVGTCTIQATQAGNTNYSAATPVSQSFQVTP